MNTHSPLFSTSYFRLFFANYKFIIFLNLILCAVFLFGCTGGPRPSQELQSSKVVKYSFDTSPSVDEISLGPGDVINAVFFLKPLPDGVAYRIQSGDTLLIEFHGAEHLNRNLVIRPDGMVTIPYLGDIKARGCTTIELSDSIRNKLRAKGLFPTLEVTLSLVGADALYRSLQDAVSNADSGKGKDVIVNNDGLLRLPLISPVAATGITLAEVQAEVDTLYAKIFPSASVLLTIKRIDSQVVYVLGEVNAPGMQRLTGKTTVSQLLAMAGGFKDTSGLSSVVLMRRDRNNQPIGRLIDVSSILSKGDMGNDMIVHRYDIVYVPPSLIHQLNQTILFGIRRMMPLDSSANVSTGFSYIYQKSQTIQ